MAFIEHVHHHYHYDEQRQRRQHAEILQLLTVNQETIMAQLDDLQTELAAIKADSDVIKTGVAAQAEAMTALHAQLTTLQQTVPPQVDLTAAVNAAADIKTQLDSIAAAFAPADAGTGTAAATSTPPSDTTTAATGTTDATSTPPADATSSPPADSTTAAAGTTDAAAAQTDTPA